MKRMNVILVLGLCLVSTASAASILDLLSWDLTSPDTEVAQQRDESDANNKNCVCDGPSCMCCVDFNFTFIDLGGPGCVRMKYISEEESILMNVSYGKSVLHSEKVKGPNPEPTCISLLASLAQVCARFTDLYPTDDGLRGCLTLEPKLLDEVQTQFAIGCFQMGPEGMKLDTTVANNTIEAEPEPEAEAEDENTTENTGIKEQNEEELLAAVNESAAEGLALFSNLLGINFGKPGQEVAEDEETATEGAQEEDQNNEAESDQDSAPAEDESRRLRS